MLQSLKSQALQLGGTDADVVSLADLLLSGNSVEFTVVGVVDESLQVLYPVLRFVVISDEADALLFVETDVLGCRSCNER